MNDLTDEQKFDYFRELHWRVLPMYFPYHVDVQIPQITARIHDTHRYPPLRELIEKYRESHGWATYLPGCNRRKAHNQYHEITNFDDKLSAESLLYPMLIQRGRSIFEVRVWLKNPDDAVWLRLST